MLINGEMQMFLLLVLGVLVLVLLREELSLEDRFGANIIHILGLNVQIPASLHSFIFLCFVGP